MVIVSPWSDTHGCSEDLVTHRFGLDQLEDAFVAVKSDVSAGKVAVVP